MDNKGVCDCRVKVTPSYEESGLRFVVKIMILYFAI